MSTGIHETGYLPDSFVFSENELPPDAYTEAQVVFDALHSALRAEQPCEQTVASIQQQGRELGLTQREVRVLRFLAIPEV